MSTNVLIALSIGQFLVLTIVVILYYRNKRAKAGEGVQRLSMTERHDAWFATLTEDEKNLFSAFYVVAIGLIWLLAVHFGWQALNLIPWFHEYADSWVSEKAWFLGFILSKGLPLLIIVVGVSGVAEADRPKKRRHYHR